LNDPSAAAMRLYVKSHRTFATSFYRNVGTNKPFRVTRARYSFLRPTHFYAWSNFITRLTVGLR